MDVGGVAIASIKTLEKRNRELESLVARLLPKVAQNWGNPILKTWQLIIKSPYDAGRLLKPISPVRLVPERIGTGP